MTGMAEYVLNWENKHAGGRLVQQVTLGDAFELALRLEASAAEMYHAFAQRFGVGRPEVARLWRALAQDELRHYEALMLAQASLALDEKLCVLLDRAELMELAKLLDRGRKEVRNPDFSPRDALKLGWAVEDSEMDYLLDVLTEVPQQPVLHQRLWEVKMATGFHREKLEELAMRLLGPQAPISQWDRTE